MNNGPVNSRAITVVGVTILGLLAAIFAGKAVATGDFRILLMGFAATIAMTIGLSLGKNYWLLIPLTFFADGSIGALPLPFSYKEIGIIGAFGLYLFQIAFKKQHFGRSTTATDVLIWINIAYLLSVYIRNPVGTLAMRTELVGGRPYFSIMLTLLAYIILSQVRVSEKMARMMPLVLVGAMLVPASLVILTEFYPPASRVIYPFYSGVSIEDFNLGISSATDTGPTRITSLANIGKPIILALCAFYPPITLVSPLYFGRFSMMAIGLILSALSGFRNLIATIGAYMLIGSAVRKRYLDILALCLIGTVGIFMLSALQMAGVPVPFAAQRALAFIPIDWDESAVRSAKGTSDWRFDMWKDAWTRPDHMRSKIYGDGFGWTMKEMLIMSDALLGIGGFMNSATYEAYLIRGSYHSGPLSTVKRVGFVGGALLLALMCAAFSYSLVLIRKTKDTPFYHWTLFMALPILYLPFEFIVVFGDYTNAIDALLFAAGMYKMIDNSLAISKANSEKEQSSPVASTLSNSSATS